MKYKGRKKYSYQEAGNIIENIMQLLSTNQECINYWKNMPRTRSDILIESMTNTSRQEAIRQVEEQNEYLQSKLDYFHVFAPDYRIKGSFGITYHSSPTER